MTILRPFRPGRSDLDGTVECRKESQDSSAQKKNLKGKWCTKPFEWFELGGQGNVYICCPTWLPMNVGDYQIEDLKDIWNGDRARRIRQSILDGSFRYCDHIQCPLIQDGRLPDKTDPNLPDKHKRYIANNQTLLEAEDELPYIYNLCFDESCNLSCPSCRVIKVVYTQGPKYEFRRVQGEKIYREIFTGSTKRKFGLSITGSGDPFGSKIFKELLEQIDGRDYPNMFLNLQTNGILFTPSKWERMWKLHDNLYSVLVSFDAATEKTYREVRRGGDWVTLLKNIHFLGKLRLEGYIKGDLRLDFVVQYRNYREVVDFVKLAKSIPGVNRVAFNLVTDWGTWNHEEYQKQCIWKSTHPEYEHFLKSLCDPVFQDPFVIQGNMAPYVDAGRKKYC